MGATRDQEPRDWRWWTSAVFVGVYLFVSGAAVTALLIQVFPTTDIEVLRPEGTAKGEAAPGDDDASAKRSEPAVRARPTLQFPALSIGETTVAPKTDQGLLLLAFLAGTMGAVLHGLQSFTVFVGNRQFKPSWWPWYAFRPLLGGMLGLLLYFVVRAGLIGAAGDSVSPYGVVSIGGLAGLFAKQAVDKLAEVFKTLFRTKEEPEYKDKLSEAPEAPRIERIEPEALPVRDEAGEAAHLVIVGDNFAADSHVRIGDQDLGQVTIESDTRIVASVPSALLPVEPGSLELRVINPTPAKVESEPFVVEVVPGGEG